MSEKKEEAKHPLADAVVLKVRTISRGKGGRSEIAVVHNIGGRKKSLTLHLINGRDRYGREW